MVTHCSIGLQQRSMRVHVATDVLPALLQQRVAASNENPMPKLMYSLPYYDNA